MKKLETVKAAVERYFKEHFSKRFDNAHLTQRRTLGYEYYAMMQSTNFTVEICFTSDAIVVRDALLIDILLNKKEMFNSSYATGFNVTDKSEEDYFYKIINGTINAFFNMELECKHYNDSYNNN